MQLDYVYPAGCRRGSSSQIEVGGNWIAGRISFGCSGEGLRAVYKAPAYSYALNKKRNTKSRRKSSQSGMVLPGQSLMSMSIDPDVKIGVRDIFIESRYELSNPLKFEISEYDELIEPSADPQMGSLTQLEHMPVCLNGRVFGSEPDIYKFRVESGQTIVAYCKSELIPAGGFIPELRITDASGTTVTNGVTLYYEKRAPVLVFKSGVSGEYVLQVMSQNGKGGRAAVYRIIIGELPLITGFTPSCVTKGRSVNIMLEGVNLDRKRVRLFSGGKDAAMCMRSFAGDALVLPGLNFELVSEIVVCEKEPNNRPDSAVALALPVVVSGGFTSEENQSDFYSFVAIKGMQLYLDLKSADIEPFVIVRDAAGSVMATGDYKELSPSAKMMAGGVSMPLNCERGGSYTIEVNPGRVGTLQPGHYRLRVGAPVPDYEIWMNPVTINIPRSGSALINLYVQRIHGFNKPISVSAALPPLGVISSGGEIAAERTNGFITVWTDGPRYPRTSFYQELVAESEYNGVVQKKKVRLLAAGIDDDSRGLPISFVKSPARIAYNEPGILIDMVGKSVLVLSGDKESEIVLKAKSIKGDLFEAYDYIVISPEKGVIIKNKIRSNINGSIRLGIVLSGEGSFLAGNGYDLIIAVVSAGKSVEQRITASQAVRFTCR